MDARQAQVHPTRQYGVFILSHGRPDKQLTYTTLRREGYTGPIRIVCDDEDSTVEQYKKNFPGEVLVFHKLDAIAKTETFYNQPYHKAVIYARGTLYDYSKELGWTHFIMMDDDYYHIYFKWNHYYKEVGLTRFKGMEAQRLDELFDATFDLLACSSASTISYAQGGDTMGGSSGKAGTHFYSRKAMNSHFVDVSKPLQFRGFVNEDVNLYAEAPMNKFIFQSNRVSVDPAHTQQYGGGATDMYLAFGTYVKSFMSVICAPSAVKVKMLGPRIHHLVKTKNVAPVLISGRWKKADGDIDVGIKENQEYIDRDIKNNYAQMELDVHPNPPDGWEDDPIDKTCKVNSMRKPKDPSKKKTASKKKGKKVEEDKQPTEISDPLLEEVKVVQPPPPPPPEVKELIIDDYSDIDLKSLAILLVGLKQKAEVRIVHGQYGSNDIVNVLSSRVGIECRPLRDGSNNIIESYCGKAKIVSFKPNEKPVFEKIPSIDFE